jgi:hypothetical protein
MWIIGIDVVLICSHIFDICESNNREVHSKIDTTPTLPQKPIPQQQIDPKKEKLRRLIQQLTEKVKKLESEKKHQNNMYE